MDEQAWWWAHVTVKTASGATYLFRVHPNQTYVSVFGSSLADVKNRLLGDHAKIVVGQRMRLDLEGDERSSSLVTSIRVDEYWPLATQSYWSDCAAFTKTVRAWG